MTGFGRHTIALNGSNITVEVKVVNSKLLDLNLRVPASIREKEMELRKMISQELTRGKAEINISVENDGAGDQEYHINKSQAKRYFESIKEITTELNISSDDALTSLMRMPEVIVAANAELSAEEWTNLKMAMEKALDQTTSFRKQEGESLEADFIERVNIILKKLAEVVVVEPRRSEQVRKKILQHLEEFLDNEKTDKNRFEQEMIYYVEKQDITEEMVRLKTHCNYFLETLEADAVSKGKKLNFISQEMGREINTIGSKAGDADIQKIVVEMKDELEKIKEQLSNVL